MRSKRVRVGGDCAPKRAIVLCALAGGLWGAVDAHAQLIPWNTPIDGNWNDTSKWTGGNVPDANGETAVLGLTGAYQVEVNNSYQIGALQMTNADAILNIAGDKSLTIVNAMDLAGILVVNTNGVSASTALRFSRSIPGAVSLTGTGTIYLNANSGNLDTGYLTTVNNTVASIGSGITVRGLGRIYGRYIHAGTIVADDPFGATLEMMNVTMQGSGALRAEGATLAIQSPGIVSQLTNVSMTASSGGKFLVHNGTTLLTGVPMTGPLTISGNAVLQQSDGVVTGNVTVNAGGGLRVTSADFTLNGDVKINHNGTGASTYLSFAQSGSLLGSGRVTLNCTLGNLDTAYLWTDANVVTTIPNGRIIDGAGRMYGRYQFGGIIRANDQLLGRPLELQNINLVSTGTGAIEAVGAPFQIQSPGVLGQVTGVSMTASNGGSFFVHNGTTQFTNVSLSGPLTVSGNATLRQDNGSVNGKLTLNAGSLFRITGPNFAHTGDMLVNHNGAGASTAMIFDQSGSLLGSGVITLNCNSANLDTAYISTESNVTAALPAGRTIEGAGRLYGRYQLGGTLRASDGVLSRPLELVNINLSGTGTGALEANGGLFQIQSPGIFGQVSNVTMTASNGGRFLVHNGSTQFTGVSMAGPLAISGNATLYAENSSISGPVTLNSGAGLRVTSAAFTHNGDMLINQNTGGSATYLYFGQTGTLGGSGTITLNCNLNNFDTAFITTESNATVTLPGTRTLAGTGRIWGKFILNGVLAPSNVSLFSPIGQIDLVNSLALGSSSSFEADIASPSSFDRITGSAPRTLGGTLKLRVVNGFVARTQNPIEIVGGSGARTGTFGSIIPPAGYSVQSSYTPTGITVALSRTCPADLNSDSLVDDADFQLFIGPYNILDCSDSLMPAWCPADLNDDTIVDDADFGIFVGGYDALICP
ncbi:MAG: hypothetical protein J0L78_13795 [Planctomycetes bacterium]|nr:hypothetical protein [Planctomycetota bacterium]